MSPEVKEFLYLIAQVAIATVTLSGITMMLAISGRSLDEARHRQILNQLRMASLVTTLSIFPLLLDLLGVNGQALWRVTSGTYLVVVIILYAYAFINKLGAIGALVLRLPSNVTATSALILLSANLWYAVPWPYLLQLFIAWNASMVLFLLFIGEILGVVGRENSA